MNCRQVELPIASLKAPSRTRGIGWNTPSQLARGPFRQGYAGNAYDFSKDLSAVVFARPNGQSDLYLLSKK
jgi:hypothetical protein